MTVGSIKQFFLISIIITSVSVRAMDVVTYEEVRQEVAERVKAAIEAGYSIAENDLSDEALLSLKGQEPLKKLKGQIDSGSELTNFLFYGATPLVGMKIALKIAHVLDLGIIVLRVGELIDLGVEGLRRMNVNFERARSSSKKYMIIVDSALSLAGTSAWRGGGWQRKMLTQFLSNTGARSSHFTVVALAHTSAAMHELDQGFICRFKIMDLNKIIKAKLI